MIGILAEKPSQMRNMAKAFGGVTGTFAGENYRLCAAAGHLYEMKDPSDMVPADMHDRIKSWDVSYLPWDETKFRWDYTTKKGASATLKSIKSALESCDEICVGGDFDPSGEGFGLQWEIFTKLGLHPKKWSRMHFEDESAPALQKAFKNRITYARLEDSPEYKKYDLRSKWDLLSMQFTRIATSFSGNRSVLREGRLKSAMTLLVGQEEDAVASYKKIPSYCNQFTDENGVKYKSKDEPMYKTKEEVPQKYKPSPVTVDSRTKKSTPPPKLLDLSALSGILSGRGFKPKQVLSVYQKMYEAQVVSYPRTEDKKITPEQFNELLPKVDAIAKVVGIDTSLLTHRTMRKTHIATGMAHGANRPGPNVPASLSAVESTYGKVGAAIYDLLAKSFLTMFGEDYEYISESGHVTDYPKFIGTCQIPVKQGYKAIFNDKDDDSEDDVNTKGLGKNATPFVAEIIPPKPPAPTIKWLIKQLEKKDIGTGATRTSTIAEITNEKSKYPLMTETKGKLALTMTGKQSYKLLPGTYIGNLDVTKRLFDDMNAVADGKKDTKQLLHDVQNMVIHDRDVMKTNSAKMRKDLGITMSEEFPEKKEKVTGALPDGTQVRFNRQWGGHTFTDDEVNALLDGKQISFTANKKAGGTFIATGKLEQQQYNGHDFWGFKLLPREGVPDQWSGHKFTETEKNMLEAGQPVHLADCVSRKTGNAFECDVTYDVDENGNKRIIPSFA